MGALRSMGVAAVALGLAAGCWYGVHDLETGSGTGGAGGSGGAGGAAGAGAGGGGASGATGGSGGTAGTSGGGGLGGAADGGSCDSGCTSGQDCVGGKCVPSCASQLTSAFSDPWGSKWDGSPRPAATLAVATQTCAAINGRLPLVSEVHRSRKGQPGALPGPTSMKLWTAAPKDASSQWTATAEDGTVSAAPTTDSLEYRCLCAAEKPGLTGSECIGPAANECYGLAASPYSFDRWDRVPLNKTGAMFECNALGAHLPTPAELARAVRSGLGDGSGQQLFLSGETATNTGTTLRWTATDTSWGAASGGISSAQHTSSQPYRCVGPVQPQAPAPAPSSGAFTSRTGRRADDKDRAAQDFAAALDTCFAQGGHLPSSTELAELILEGLPSGSGAGLLTVDHVSATHVVGLRWTGVDTRFAFGASVSSVDKAAASAFRCVYYSVDSTLAGPGSGQCQTACKELSLTGGGKLWIDDANRSATSFAVAVDACSALGAEIAGLRDLLEGVRHGLSTASTGKIHAAEFVNAPFDGGQLDQLMVVDLAAAATNPAQASAYSILQHGANNPYRCRWTNEVR